MKKTYISPEMLTVSLNTRTNILIANSNQTLHQDSSGNIVGGLIDDNAGSAGLVKEDVNLWDEEW